MDAIQALILGVVQGLTEFLPVSSTAHLVLIPWGAGWHDPGLAFDVALHLGTLFASCLYFRRELVQVVAVGSRIVKGACAPTDPGWRLGVFLVVGTLPAAVVGVAAHDVIASTLRQPTVVAAALIAVAVLILAIERRAPGTKLVGDAYVHAALLIGTAQACALVPGVSRSGACIAAALVLGYARPEAVRLSFLLGIPAILGASVLEAKELFGGGVDVAFVPLVVGTVAAAASGYLCMAGLVRFVRTNLLTPFMIYRIALGGVVLWCAQRGFALG